MASVVARRRPARGGVATAPCGSTPECAKAPSSQVCAHPLVQGCAGADEVHLTARAHGDLGPDFGRHGLPCTAATGVGPWLQVPARGMRMRKSAGGSDIGPVRAG